METIFHYASNFKNGLATVTMETVSKQHNVYNNKKSNNKNNNKKTITNCQ